jgi:hypothetical protein
MTAACRGDSIDPAARDVASATKETEAWRAMHEASYRRDWVTIAGLHFLEPGSHTAGADRKTTSCCLRPLRPRASAASRSKAKWFASIPNPDRACTSAASRLRRLFSRR